MLERGRDTNTPAPADERENDRFGERTESCAVKAQLGWCGPDDKEMRWHMAQISLYCGQTLNSLTSS